MAMTSSQTAVLTVLIRAQNTAQATLLAASRDVEGFGKVMSNVGRTAIIAGAGLGAATAGVAAGIGELVAQASSYQTTLQNVQGNTILTTANMKQMHDAVLALGQESGANFADLAQGMMHVSNVGYSMADAITIARAGMESAVASGSNVTAVINTLATVMREFNAPASEAGRIMDEIHVAAALGNSSLEAFVEGGSKAHAMAAALHMPLEQIDAAFVAMTRHGFDVATSSTYLTGMLSKMAGVSGQSLAALRALSSVSGIDLVADFQNVGKQGHSLVKVISDLRTALDAMPEGARLSAAQIKQLGAETMAQGGTQKEATAVMKAATGAMGGHVAELFRLIPAMRGGLAAMVLTGAGFNDLTTATKNTTAAINGQIIPAMGVAGPTATAYAEALKTVGNQMAVLERNVQGTAIVLGEAFLPQVNRLLGIIGPVVKQFADWAKAHADVIARVLPLVVGVGALASAMLLVGGAAAIFIATLNPVSVVLMAIVGAIGLLATAWVTNWGGMRQALAGAWAGIQPAFTAISDSINSIVDDFRTMPLGTAIEGAFAIVNADFSRFGGQIVAWMDGAATQIKAHTKAWATAFSNWITPVTAGAGGQMKGYTDALTEWVQSDGVKAMVNLGNTMADALSAAIVASLKKNLSIEALLHAITSGGAPGLTPTGGGVIGWIANNPTFKAAGNQKSQWDKQFSDWLNGVSGTVPTASPSRIPTMQTAPGGAGHQLDALTGIVSMTHARAAEQAADRAAKDALTIAAQVSRITFPSTPMSGASTVALERGRGLAGAPVPALPIPTLDTIASGGMARAMTAAVEAATRNAAPPAGSGTSTTAGGGTALSSGPSTQVNISVNVASGAVSVSTAGNASGTDESRWRQFAIKVGTAMADAAELAAKGEAAALSGSPATLAGAR